MLSNVLYGPTTWLDSCWVALRLLLLPGRGSPQSSSGSFRVHLLLPKWEPNAPRARTTTWYYYANHATVMFRVGAIPGTAPRDRPVTVPCDVHHRRRRRCCCHGFGLEFDCCDCDRSFDYCWYHHLVVIVVPGVEVVQVPWPHRRYTFWCSVAWF